MHTYKTAVLLAFAVSISAYSWDTELDARDLDDYLDAEELFVRNAKGGSAARWGGRVERGTNAAGNVGTALSGIADFGNMVRGQGKRDLEAAELLVRSAKGGSAARWGGRVERGTNAAGNVGTALSGIADFGNMVRGQGKRDLEAEELFVRNAKGGSAARWGGRVERGTNAAGNVGSALSGIADIGNMIRGNGGQGKRDLEFEELMVRAAKGGAARGGAAQWGRRLERGTNAAGNVGSALSGIADVGNMIRGRDVEDFLFDDSELFAREEFEFEDFEY